MPSLELSAPVTLPLFGLAVVLFLVRAFLGLALGEVLDTVSVYGFVQINVVIRFRDAAMQSAVYAHLVTLVQVRKVRFCRFPIGVHGDIVNGVNGGITGDGEPTALVGLFGVAGKVANCVDVKHCFLFLSSCQI